MTSRSPEEYLGRYVAFEPKLLSVFSVVGLPKQRWFVERFWPWLVESVTLDSLQLKNTTTHHVYALPISNVLDSEGQFETPPNYQQPIKLRLRVRIFWDRYNVWSEPIEPAATPIRSPHRRRLRRVA
jgi:hypothetical protein